MIGTGRGIMEDAQARKTRAFFQPDLSFKCCSFFFISSKRHGSRFHKLYEQEKKIRKIHNFFVKNQISKPLLTLDNSLLNNHSKMKINQSFNLVFNQHHFLQCSNSNQESPQSESDGGERKS